MSPRQGPEFVPGESITDMVEKMQKFVFPPKMDFITNGDVQPFAMYIFEFSTILDRQDLTDIWQNVLPEIGRTFETQSLTVSHPLLVTELMGCDSLKTGKKVQNQLQWMVFKVKQKAKTNYYEKVVGSQKYSSNFASERAATSSKIIGSKYSYNWPYDFFSLVELAKIDAAVEFGEDPFMQIQKGSIDMIGKNIQDSLRTNTLLNTSADEEGEG